MKEKTEAFMCEGTNHYYYMYARFHARDSCCMRLGPSETLASQEGTF